MTQSRAIFKLMNEATLQSATLVDQNTLEAKHYVPLDLLPYYIEIAYGVGYDAGMRKEEVRSIIYKENKKSPRLTSEAFRETI